MLAMEAGRVIGDKYKLVRLLGRGSMGQVWVAFHMSLGEEVAVKLLAAPAPIDGAMESPSTSTARFRFEAQVAARLSRKTRHIVRVTDHGEEDDGVAYLVMELLEGQTLEHLLLQRHALPPLEIAKLVSQIARALEQAHSESIIHRDLKPANVFVTHDEDGGMLIKLLDFGIARAIRAQRVPSAFSTGEGLIFGTPGYMSPEQACASSLDTRCDLWALATVAYEGLTGQLPVGGACTEELLKNLQAGNLVPVHERNPNVPYGLRAFFEKAFAPKIDQRFGSASELALAFGQAAASGTCVPTKTVPLPPTVREAVRGETLLAVGAPQRPRPRRAFAKLVFVAPATLLGLAVAVVAWRVPASSPPAAGIGMAAASTVERPLRTRTEPPAAPVGDADLVVLHSTLTASEEVTTAARRSGISPAERPLARGAVPAAPRGAPMPTNSSLSPARQPTQAADALPLAPSAAGSQSPPGGPPPPRKRTDKSAVL